MKYIKINPADNVAVALQDLAKGEVVEGVTLQMDIPRGHKIVLHSLKAGENVIKYGFPIGHVTRDAEAGTLVDHSCIKTNLEGLLDYKYEPLDYVKADQSQTKTFSTHEGSEKVLSAPSVVGSGTKTFSTPQGGAKKFCSLPTTFKGFRRADGQVGIRNQIWVIPTVGCVNGICEQIVSKFKSVISTEAEGGVEKSPSSVDAIVCFPHNYGCSQLGDDHENTRKVLADMIHHPNEGRWTSPA